jgi:hypothetical protein
MKTEVYEEKNRAQTRTGKSGSSISDGDQEEMMKKVEAAGTPGPAHKALQALVGDWKAEVKCWMDASGSPDVTREMPKRSGRLMAVFWKRTFMAK